ncbi:MAG: lysylphosphatidylglycerol synthase transmembrane domain-containing protein [Acidimicrobiales bacterium]
MTAEVAPVLEENRTGDASAESGADADSEGGHKKSAKRKWKWARRALLVGLSGVAVWFLAQRGAELRGAGHLLSRADWRLVAIAVLFEAASMVVFARMQRWLLRAGDVRLPLRTMVEITLAGNAIATTLPGGVAWAAAWAFGQLRRRGVDRFLRVWVFLVAGAVSSFALFVVVAVGIEVAGGRGPVAGLRWAALGLAAIPVAALLVSPAKRLPPVQHAAKQLGAFVRRHVPGGRKLLTSEQKLVEHLEAVHLSPLQWAEVLGLGLLNWLYDCAVLVCAMEALHLGVPWRAIFVIYGVTQIAASLPITPGGVLVVEGSLAAMLTAYGVHTEAALATVVVYRVVSFWGLVPIGWGVWIALDLMQRRGLVRRVHPWAFHTAHTDKEKLALLPDPAPCHGCDEEAKSSKWSASEVS